jgi:hypothetical protein
MRAGRDLEPGLRDASLAETLQAAADGVLRRNTSKAKAARRLNWVSGRARICRRSAPAIRSAFNPSTAARSAGQGR